MLPSASVTHKENYNAMNPKKLVKISNLIGIVSIILLIYWVFILTCIEVFGLKVFKQNITETFYLSILGILALMFGALMINIMFNLTRIADKQNADAEDKKDKNLKAPIIAFLLSFPLIFGLLVGGDYYTAYAKEKSMIRAGRSILEDNEEKVRKIADYEYSIDWLKNTKKELELFSKVDRYFPSVSVLVKDTMDNYKVYLRFTDYTYLIQDSIMPPKQDLIKSTTQEERDYLSQIFDKGELDLRFSKHRGNYELFYPYQYNGKTVVFYFSDYQQYGKVAYDSYPNEAFPEAVPYLEELEEVESDTIQ